MSDWQGTPADIDAIFWEQHDNATQRLDTAPGVTVGVDVARTRAEYIGGLYRDAALLDGKSPSATALAETMREVAAQLEAVARAENSGGEDQEQP